MFKTGKVWGTSPLWTTLLTKDINSEGKEADLRPTWSFFHGLLCKSVILTIPAVENNTTNDLSTLDFILNNGLK